MTSKPSELILAEALADFTLKIAAPIAWHDGQEGWPKRIWGGTCFFLRFASGIIGVTANHVVEALQRAIADNPNTICQIRTSKPIDFLGLIVARCNIWDIATFYVS